jgi:uncharacterized protein (TIGR03663 family)
LSAAYPRLTRWFSVENLFILIFILTFLLRFLFLDLRLFHHDEAIHAWFSYELLTKGAYTYDPMYHGPFLYYVTAGMFYLFGSSDLVARILPALFGALLVPLVYAIYRLGYLDARQGLIAAAFVAVSPDLVYFSRFLRHDIFQLFFTLLILVALLYYLERKKLWFALVAGLAVGGGMTLKEDFPLFLVILVTFAIFLWWKQKIHLPPTWKRDLILALIVAGAIIVAFYSSFGGQWDILYTGLLKAWNHWTAMHEACRICGPPYFYILLLLLYEVPIFVLAIFGVMQFIDRHNPFPGWKEKIKGYLHREPGKTFEIGEITEKLGKDGNVPWNKKEIFFAFSIWWMVITLAAYAYIGEKVPWLIIHQLLPMIFVAVYLMTPNKTIVAVIGIIFLLFMTWHVAFTPGDINEPIVQVQNSEDLREVMAQIDNSSVVMIASKDYWPLPWYYRGDKWDKMRFYGQIVDQNTIDQVNPDMIITHDLESYPCLPGYDKATYKLSYWFSIYDQEDRLPEYYFQRDGKLGSINIDVFTRNASATGCY